MAFPDVSRKEIRQIRTRRKAFPRKTGKCRTSRRFLKPKYSLQSLFIYSSLVGLFMWLGHLLCDLRFGSNGATDVRKGQRATSRALSPFPLYLGWWRSSPACAQAAARPAHTTTTAHTCPAHTRHHHTGSPSSHPRPPHTPTGEGICSEASIFKFPVWFASYPKLIEFTVERSEETPTSNTFLINCPFQMKETEIIESPKFHTSR